MVGVLSISVAMVLWTVVVRRVGNIRRPGAERSLWFVLAMFACAITVTSPGLRQLVDKLFDPLGGSAWVWTCCAVLAATGAQCLVVHTPASQAAKRLASSVTLPLTLGSLAVTAVTVSFVAPGAPQAPTESSAEVALRAPFYAGGGWAALRWGVWLALLTWALLGMTRVTSRYAAHAREARPGQLTTGLSLGGLGCRIGYGYVVIKVVVVTGWLSGQGSRLVVADQVADLIALTSIVFIILGSTHDVMMARLRTTQTAVRRACTWWRLRRLAVLLRQAAPADAAPIAGHGIRARLRQRVLGIRDRQLALRHYVDADLPRIAHHTVAQAGVMPSAIAVIAEAAWLEAARLARLSGRSAYSARKVDPEFEATGGTDLDEEADWLLLLAHAQRRNPIVRMFAEEYLRDYEPDAA